ncbi:putative motility protein [Salinisphaera sp.]|uniref:putative motility protein n=1 Tax=Salinisphaera sp. TaxID=1914330 RepID=UPI002D79D865|nr:putative motility protein [Salinisphaera sp.]HET7314200.1 putative motility protein [Salinisphaera sp.]
MDAGSVNSTVSTALALQQHNQNQDVQANLLRKSLDSQASQMSQLMSSLETQPALATTGSVGTQINTYA